MTITQQTAQTGWAQYTHTYMVHGPRAAQNAREISIAQLLGHGTQIGPLRCKPPHGGAKTKEEIEINP
jgi:hypothetical protein